jgi:hypothetical protein
VTFSRKLRAYVGIADPYLPVHPDEDPIPLGYRATGVRAQDMGKLEQPFKPLLLYPYPTPIPYNYIKYSSSGCRLFP